MPNDGRDTTSAADETMPLCVFVCTAYTHQKEVITLFSFFYIVLLFAGDFVVDDDGEPTSDYVIETNS